MTNYNVGAKYEIGQHLHEKRKERDDEKQAEMKKFEMLKNIKAS